jgi:flagellar basal-body rod protein FlgB
VKLGNAFGIHEQALTVRNQRNEILASNIANADTPGYKARDIDFRQVLKQQKVEMPNLKATQAGHFQTASVGRVSPQYIQYRQVAQPSLDGNTVDVQQEQLQFSNNAARYEATMRFLNGKISGLQKAISGK